MAISTLILIVLGVLILTALVLAFTGSFERFWNMIKGYSGNDIDNLNKICQTQCNLDNSDSFCCENKKLGKEFVTCDDNRLDIDCDIECKSVCGINVT